jgi:lipoprotein-releasing system permease protein
MLSFSIALRFLRSSPVQSVLIVLGIAVGIATQVFVGSLIQSLQASLLETTIGSSPQVTVQAQNEGDPVAYTADLQSTVEDDPRVEPGTVAKLRTLSTLYVDGGPGAPLGLLGGDLSEIDGIFGLTDKIESGMASLTDDRIVVGTDFATKHGIEVGDRISLLAPEEQNLELTVAGIFDFGNATFNERNAFVSGEIPLAVLGWEQDQFSAVEAQLADPFASEEVAADWRVALPDLEVTEWQAENESLLTGLRSQASSSYMIQGFVLVAVALGIGSTLAIAATQKTRQIGILKAMGLSDRRAGRIFLWEAAVLGALGSGLGIAFAYGLLALFALAPLTFTVSTQPLFVVGSFFVGVGVALLSSLIPIRRTSRLDPIEVIQNA